MPLLRGAGIAFHNPQVEEWTPSLVEVEARAKANGTYAQYTLHKPQTVEYALS